MSTIKKFTILLLAVASIFILPWLGSFIKYNGSFPTDFFSYPPISPLPKEPFSWVVFILTALIFLTLICLYLFPKIFGFKNTIASSETPPPKVSLPVWFWIGIVIWGGTFLLTLIKVGPMWLLNWADVPLFWGAVLLIDAKVYVRTGGKSLISEVPHELFAIGIASIPGWMYYEYLNFFVCGTWYYPFADIVSDQEILMYAILTSSALMPLAFEWYCLFNTFSFFKQRFSLGYKIILPQKAKLVILFIAVVLLFLTGYIPTLIFPAIWWVVQPIILAITLDLIGIWTPFKPIGRGNWSPLLLFALAYLIEGIILEFQNYMDIVFKDLARGALSYNPLYWKYSVPYVDVLHIFEMPLIGYAGYFPFSIYVWLWWIAFATLMGVPSRFYKETPLEIE